MLSRHPESNKNRDSLHHIFWYEAQEGQCAFLMSVTIQMFYAFSTFDYYFVVFSLLFLGMSMPKGGTVTQTRMRIGSLTFPNLGSTELILSVPINIFLHF